MPKVIVVEDDDLTREAIETLVSEGGFEVAGHAHPQPLLEDFPPDVACVITDVRMAPMDGLELTRRLLGIDPNLPIVVVSGRADIPIAVEAMKLGARDFLEKRNLRDQLVGVVRALCEASPPPAEPDPRLAGLTAREREILRQVARGRTSPEIAAGLSISKRTVDAHRRALMSKLGATRVGHLVRIATEAGEV